MSLFSQCLFEPVVLQYWVWEIARNIDFILSANLLACLSVISFVIGMFSWTTIGYDDLRVNCESPICCYNRMKSEWLLRPIMPRFVSLLKPGPFCSLLMGVQAAFGNRGRSTIHVNYRILSKFIFVNVISLVLTSLCGKLSRMWSSARAARNATTMSDISWAVGERCEKQARISRFNYCQM
jgi:hypothetical protein